MYEDINAADGVSFQSPLPAMERVRVGRPGDVVPGAPLPTAQIILTDTLNKQESEPSVRCTVPD